MPIYEYRCAECGFQKEFLRRLSDAPLADCPKCGKRAFNKMVSAAGFQLKGTGWYATDFRNSGAKPAAKQDKPADSPKPAEGSKSAESPKSAESSKSAENSKPAESSTKESSKTDASPSAGASPVSG